MSFVKLIYRTLFFNYLSIAVNAITVNDLNQWF